MSEALVEAGLQGGCWTTPILGIKERENSKRPHPEASHALYPTSTILAGMSTWFGPNPVKTANLHFVDSNAVPFNKEIVLGHCNLEKSDRVSTAATKGGGRVIIMAGLESIIWDPMVLWGTC